MPRNVRNFLIDLDVDGMASHIVTGPRGRDEGFSTRIRYRENGNVSDKHVFIAGFGPNREGKIRMEITIPENATIERCFNGEYLVKIESAR